ncbi:MAG: hypothetical protein JWP30_1702 [Homoserinimonas sp.]|jgi:hypothetical protein|nr:hypothetical protein [Homoserinimonas sp.]
MKNLLWFLAGIGAGFLAAHQVNKTPEGKRFFASVDTVMREFSGAVVDGYKAREAELRDTVVGAEARIADLTRRDQD